jgi:SAM-dependent methyltransferase
VYKEVNEILPAETFDLVVISHVLEHTSHPQSFILQCTQQLVEGGVLFVEVPCKDYEHKNIVEPHLLFFDKAPLERLLINAGFVDIRLSYYGNTIADLKKGTSFSKRMVNKFRNAFLRAGILFPFAGKCSGLEGIDDSLERACVKPFKAHLEQSEPSWWLRAVAIKN